ncbi:SDR family NAD(P)-dependent oxidoreductase [Wenjunlia tyrosinilytica]|uniref:Oxidoreductase n=1 Tax=Wenjunlia tyrosinilytica TaxID=1544741 RepID=A0A918DYN9_9ACTN|nr:SDR family oxidoreductase [Wenjunlia tyrosinilytica]GGO88458.1 oxidoreductase [Wenjunlia tyrosinilytica]
MARFEGHAVFVTGAGQGMGEAIALRFAREGARVAVTDRDSAKAEAAARRIGEATGSADSAFPHLCDVADPESVNAAVVAAVERFGRLDVLVNNAASVGAGSDLRHLTEEGWARDMDITLTGAFRCAKAAMPHLIASGRGAVVNIGSVNGQMYFGDHAYSAAKAGLSSLTRTLAVEYARHGVRVNLVAPGTTRTPNWDGEGGAEFLERVVRHYPLGRVGEPSDIAAACAFLASCDASWITGVTLPVDGGLLVANLGMLGPFED